MAYLTPRYDLSLVAASVLIASFASYVALDLAKRVRGASCSVALTWWVGGSIAMGTGIWSMHFVGMLAFSLPIALGYTGLLTFVSWVAAVAVSAVAPMAASMAALLIFFWLRNVSKHRELACQVAAATVMGLAISGMHYTGMAAASFPVGSVCLSATALSGGTLSLLVGV